MAPEAFMGVLVPFAICALIFGIFYLKTRENMALIEKGMNPNQKNSRPRPSPFVSLKYGLLLLGSGIGFLIAYLVDTLVLNHHVVATATGLTEQNSDNPAIYFAMIAIGGGIGLILSYRVEKKEWLDKVNKEGDGFSK